MGSSKSGAASWHKGVPEKQLKDQNVGLQEAVGREAKKITVDPKKITGNIFNEKDTRAGIEIRWLCIAHLFCVQGKHPLISHRPRD